MKRIFKYVCLGILLLFVIFVSFVTVKYFVWRKIFNEEKITMYCTSNMPEVTFNIEDKIKNYVLSNSTTAYLEFSIDETMSFLKDYVKVSDSLKANDMCVNAKKGKWEVYLDLEVGKINLPWVRFDIVKDDRETAELFVSDIFLGNVKIGKILSEKILSDMNKGISDGVLMVNENNFLGREISNIELFEDKVVVR
ncbi:MAG: hypothetical protein ACOX6Q_02995 [Candidatus Dojkabacteria bacterium]|jgi:hypothetical protein